MEESVYTSERQMYAVTNNLFVGKINFEEFLTNNDRNLILMVK